MATVRDALAYVLKHYPHNARHELSNARVTKMLYLADWHQILNHRRQVTEIDWYFDNYGPYVNDVRVAAEGNPDIFTVHETRNIFGSPKILLALHKHDVEPNLSDQEKASLDHVIEQTKSMSWDSFIKLVYSTYPITSSDRYSHLDLAQKANEYQH